MQAGGTDLLARNGSQRTARRDPANRAATSTKRSLPSGNRGSATPPWPGRLALRGRSTLRPPSSGLCAGCPTGSEKRFTNANPSGLTSSRPASSAATPYNRPSWSGTSSLWERSGTRCCNRPTAWRPPARDRSCFLLRLGLVGCRSRAARDHAGWPPLPVSFRSPASVSSMKNRRRGSLSYGHRDCEVVQRKQGFRLHYA